MAKIKVFKIKEEMDLGKTKEIMGTIIIKEEIIGSKMEMEKETSKEIEITKIQTLEIITKMAEMAIIMVMGIITVESLIDVH